jgi:hypothetical protein
VATIDEVAARSIAEPAFWVMLRWVGPLDIFLRIRG